MSKASNGRSPTMSMADFNARAKQLAERIPDPAKAPERKWNSPRRKPQAVQPRPEEAAEGE